MLVRFVRLSELRFKITSVTWIAIVEYENQSHLHRCHRISTDLLLSDPSVYWCVLGNHTCTWIEDLTCELLSKVAIGMQHRTSFKFSCDPSHHLLFLSSLQRVESVQNGLWGVKANKYAERKRQMKHMGFIAVSYCLASSSGHWNLLIIWNRYEFHHFQEKKNCRLWLPAVCYLSFY